MKKVINKINELFDPFKRKSGAYKRFIFRVFVLVALIESLVLLIIYYKQIAKFLLSFFKGLQVEHVAGLIGLLGVLVGVILSEIYKKQHEKSIERKDLITDYLNVINDLIAHIRRIEHFQLINNKSRLREEKINQYKFYTQFLSLQFKSWSIYNNSWIRSATARLNDSIITIFSKLYQDPNLIPKFYDICESWLNEQMEELMHLLTKNAGIETVDGGTPMFIKFGKITAIDLKKLKSRNDAPPWEPYFELNIQNETNKELKNIIIAQQLKKIQDYRCENHGYAPHVIAYGEKIENFSIQIIGCCEEFCKKINTKFDNKNNFINK